VIHPLDQGEPVEHRLIPSRLLDLGIGMATERGPEGGIRLLECFPSREGQSRQRGLLEAPASIEEALDAVTVLQLEVGPERERCRLLDDSLYRGTGFARDADDDTADPVERRQADEGVMVSPSAGS
jgi:hypothetical protein